MPKVSIIIPVYNKEIYLERTLRIILNQKYSNYELILIDDGSTDRSLDIINYWAKKFCNVKVIHQKNSGVSVARNKGLEIASGEWIWFIDADDMPNEFFLEEVKELLENSQYDIIFADYQKKFPNGEVIYVSSGIEGCMEIEKFSEHFMEIQYKTGFYGYLWCKLIRRSFLKKNSIQFESGLTLAEDLKFMVQVYKRNPSMYFWKGTAMRYTVEAIESSKDKRVDYRSQFDIQKDIYNWICNMKVETIYLNEQKERLGDYVAYIFYYAYEEKHSIREEKEWFCNYPDLDGLIRWRQGRDIMSLITMMACRKCFWGIEVILCGRSLLKNLLNTLR